MKYTKLFLYLFGIKKSGQRGFNDKMNQANETERKTLFDLRRHNYSINDIVNIGNDFNKKYRQKHKKDYITQLHGETMHIEEEKYNLQKSIVFERYTQIYYLRRKN